MSVVPAASALRLYVRAQNAQRLGFGVEAMLAAHPTVPVYTASLDRELNSKGYILPGLGDAGDRLFGTR